MRGLLQDLRYAGVVPGKNAGATATVLLSLALAIGLNATFFSFLSGVLYRPLHLGDPDRLAAVVTWWEGDEGNSHSSHPDFRVLAARHPLFDGVAAHFHTAAGIKTDEGPEIVLVQLASASYFHVMGVPRSSAAASGRRKTRRLRDNGWSSSAIGCGRAGSGRAATSSGGRGSSTACRSRASAWPRRASSGRGPCSRPMSGCPCPRRPASPRSRSRSGRAPRRGWSSRAG